MERTPMILDIKGNSLDDGPGIRTVVFFKGCPLDCAWCHNPESKKTGREIAFDRKECVACDTCMDLCPERALSRENPYFIDRERCTRCGVCVGGCPSGALSLVGREMTIDEITAEVIKDRPFFETSGGGVTVSGGEPALFMGFLSGLLGSMKNNGVRTLIETCGYFKLDDFRKKIIPFADMIYFDIKIIDPADHRRYCGVSNELILENFIALRELEATGGFTLLPRTPLVPDITDREKNLRAIADFYRRHEITRAAVLPYNPLWKEKSERIGESEAAVIGRGGLKWMKNETVIRCREIFREHGIET